MGPSSLKILEICDEIAALQIEVVGPDSNARMLRILAPRDMRLSLADEQLPVLQPRPNGFVFNMSPMRRDSYGSDAGYKSGTFELHWTLYFATLAEEVEALDKYVGLVECVNMTLSQIADQTDRISSATEIFVGGVSAFGPVVDGVGAPYHGAGIYFAITRYLEQ